MASSSSSTIPAAAADERDRKRKRDGGEPETDEVKGRRQDAPSRWRTRREHEIYSSKLLDALRLVRAGKGALPSAAREVRQAADRALAVAARGRSRWSRAVLLLASRSRARAHRVRVRVRSRAPAPAPQPQTHRPSTGASTSSSGAPALARKAQELGRLVPGCRKLPFPALLSEASDYIAALEMQVRAMAALAHALASVAPPSPSPS
ncbi:transcription factor bHLH149 [Lolium perenne]|uniref:transcription factor bHLH149 n=1 Tax=Lolium perenne TaxID=4522 RepID=UPI0021EACC74|nr:transcription factor bHLH149-like [Lolium perenne]